MAFPEHGANFPEDTASEPDLMPAMPHHGFRGERGPEGLAPGGPQSLTIAISREAGSRGGSIARRAAAKLGWQVYTQELLEYLAQEGSPRQDLLDALSPEAARWSEQRLEQLLREQ